MKIGKDFLSFLKHSLEREIMPEYTEYAQSGLKEKLPKIEVFPNQFKGYEITISIPEYTSICPKTGLPDSGLITIKYMPSDWCVELKSLKMYILAYRNLGIFYENAVNRILDDIVSACRPVWAEVKGEFKPRGGISTVVEARYPRGQKPDNRGGRPCSPWDSF